MGARLWHVAATVAVYAGLVFVPAAADAATVRVEGSYPNGWGCKLSCPPATFTVVFEATPGATNDVSVSGGPDGTLITDSGEPVTPRGSDCTAIDQHTVRCRADASVVVRTRDGDDAVALVTPAGTRERVEAGRGNDRVVGSPRDDVLSGGPGNDELYGGGGDDRLVDGVRRPSPSVGNDDFFDGGEGNDWVEYTERLAPVTVDLPAGARGGTEHDRLSAIENAAGGLAGDRLTGDGGPNSLSYGGGPGLDVLDGRGGDDRLLGGRIATGGPGRDYFGAFGAPPVRYSGPGGLRRVDCGEDRDVVDGFGSKAVVDESCESIAHGPDVARQQLPLRSLEDPVVVYDQYDDGFPSEKRLQLRATGVGALPEHPPAGTLLGEARARADQIPLRLSDRGAELLRRYGAIRARVIVADPGLAFLNVSYLVDLRAPSGADGG